MTEYAQTEELQLICDIPYCQSQLSLISGVDRSEHGWGRISVYATPTDPYTVRDYDLCQEHNTQLINLLNPSYNQGAIYI